MSEQYGRIDTNIRGAQSNLLIRPALPTDAKAISQLISSVASAFTLHPDGRGAEAFLAKVSAQAIEGYIKLPNFKYFVTCDGEDIVGVVALRDDSHLYSLFVAQPFQRRGLGKILWHYAMNEARAHGNTGTFTVNSSPYAIPVYESFGFVKVGEKVEMDGIAFVPMRLSTAI